MSAEAKASKHGAVVEDLSVSGIYVVLEIRVSRRRYYALRVSRRRPLPRPGRIEAEA